MHHQRLETRIVDGGVEGVDQADLAVHLPQQGQAAPDSVGTGEVSSLKIRLDLLVPNAGKQQR